MELQKEVYILKSDWIYSRRGSAVSTTIVSALHLRRASQNVSLEEKH